MNIFRSNDYRACNIPHEPPMNDSTLYLSSYKVIL